MADVNYQFPMQLMELLGLRGWEASQPRVYWGLRRPDGLPDSWYAPNAGLGGGAGWGGYQGGYGTTTGGGGGFGTATGVGGAGGAPAFFSASRFSAPDVGGAGASEPGSFSGAGQGINAESTSFGDFLGSLGTALSLAGPTGAIAAPLALGLSDYLGVAPSLSLTGVARSAFGGSDANTANDPQFGAAGGRNVSAPNTFGGLSDLDISLANDAAAQSGGVDVPGGYGGNADSSPDANGDHSGFAMGGPVTLNRLIGPNPPGPDDGYAALDAGEHVLTADEVRALGGHAGVMRLRDMLRR